MNLLRRHEPGEAPLQIRDEEISIGMLAVGLYASTHFTAGHLLRPPKSPSGFVAEIRRVHIIQSVE
jgi:hypothetical protein